MGSESMLHVYPIAPSGPFLASKYEEGIGILKSLGCQVDQPMPLRRSEAAYLNGDDAERLHELTTALNSTQHQAAWAIRGGYGLTRLLPMLPNPTQQKTPIVIGFSDTSALMMHLWANGQRKSLHAATITKLVEEPQSTLDALSLILQGRATEVIYPIFSRLQSQNEKTIEGVLLPCNLCTLTHLVGTKSMPRLAGSILLLEEIGEHPYRIDRMLTQLWASGTFTDIKAVVIGYLTASSSTKDEQPKESLNVFRRFFGQLSIPLFGQIPVGHESPNWPIPFGVKARLQDDGKSVRIEILENVF